MSVSCPPLGNRVHASSCQLQRAPLQHQRLLPSQRLQTGRLRAAHQQCRAQNKDPSLDNVEKAVRDEESKDPSQNALFQGLWHASEQFGNLVGLSKGSKGKANATAKTADLPKMSRTQCIQQIKEDYQANYFISGLGDMSAYEDNCLFADPFSAFRGVARFKKNVSNFSGLLKDVNLRISKFEEQPDYVRAYWTFSAGIKLPWNPRIAAKGYTSHVISRDTGRVLMHKEEWDTEPSQVIRQLFSRSRNPRP